MLRILPAAAMLIAAAAHAHDAGLPNAAVSRKIQLPGKEFHEECLELAARQRLAYAFRASRALQFNIHYHAGDKTLYAVRKNSRRAHAAYVPHAARGYCLMWTNPRAAAVELEYSLSVSPD
jgi:hypothetical protein